MTLVLNAFAKVNLCLAVLGRRPDGYHEVQTVLHQVDLADRLTISAADEISLEVTGIPVPQGPENLAWRAARLLRDRYGTGHGARILVEKNIPPGAGLGGGSADAAAVLLGLNELWGLGRSREELAAVAAGLGSDVPFFLFGGTALATGRGERIEPLPRSPSLLIVLANPGFSVPTAEIYAALEDDDFRHPPDVAGMLQAVDDGSPHRIAASLANSLEGPCFRLHPSLAEVKTTLLAAGALGALLSGSGSTVFAIAETPARAQLLAARLRGRGWRADIVRSLKGFPPPGAN